MTYSIDTQPNESGPWRVYLYWPHGPWMATLFPDHWTGEMEQILNTYFYEGWHGEARPLLAVLTDELKERGLLPM